MKSVDKRAYGGVLHSLQSKNKSKRVREGGLPLCMFTKAAERGSHTLEHKGARVDEVYTIKFYIPALL